MKAYYSEFVRHCLRHYIKTLDEGHGGVPAFRNDAERENWSACYQVLKNYSEADMEVISELYRPGDTIADKIYMLSKTKRTSQGTFWNLVSDIEREIAKKRGLV